jgi:DNA polymerase
MRLLRDYETRSEVSVADVGPRQYFAHPSTEILCVGWSVDRGSPRVAVVVGGSDGRAAVERRVREAGVAVAQISDFQADFRLADAVVAHNQAFEIACEDYLLPNLARVRETKFQSCTAARARRMSLPGSLEDACRVLRTPHQKSVEGHAQMLQCSQVRPAHRASGTGPKWFEDADRLAKVATYCAGDILAECDLDAYLPELPDAERRYWLQTELGNRRGVPLDHELVAAMAEAVEQEAAGALAAVRQMTGDPEFALTNPEKIRSFCAWRGVPLADLRKETVEGVLEAHRQGTHPRDPLAIAVLEARRDVGGKTSASKLPRMTQRVMSDGRARDLVIYHGAHTGRDTGDGINTLNLPRPYKGFDQDFVLDCLRRRDYASLRAGQKVSVSTAVSAALRGVIHAGRDRKLVVGDYASVEPAFYFTIAGDRAAVDVLARGESLYIEFGRSAYGRELDKKKDLIEYTIAKNTVLGCGYGMGLAKFIVYLARAGVTIPDDQAERIHRAYRTRFALLCDPRTGLWTGLGEAAKSAVRYPGAMYECAGIRFVSDGWWLVMFLPSGRPFYYPNARLVPGKYDDEIIYEGWIRIDGRPAGWGDVRTWGGMLLENATQAACRDLMETHKQEVEAIPDWEVLMTTYDEIAAGAPQDYPDAKDVLHRIMARPPAWLPGMPVRADVFEAANYRKG